jgi:hypothetical protein
MHTDFFYAQLCFLVTCTLWGILIYQLWQQSPSKISAISSPPDETESPPPPEDTESPPPPEDTENVLTPNRQQKGDTSVKPSPFWTFVFYIGPTLIIIFFLWYQVRVRKEIDGEHEVTSPIPVSSLKMEYLRMKYLFFRSPLQRLLFEKATKYNTVFVYIGDWRIRERLGELQKNEIYVDTDEFFDVCKFIKDIYDELDEFFLMRFRFRVVFNLSMDNSAPDLIGPFSSHNENIFRSAWDYVGLISHLILRKYIQFLLYGRKTILQETLNSLGHYHFRCQQHIPSSYDLRENWCPQSCSLTMHDNFCA